MNTATTNSLRVSRTIATSPERLFRAWTDPKELAHWWRMEGDGWAFAGAEVDVRVGGTYRRGMTSPDGRKHVAVGVYREVKRPTRLSFTWDWEDPASRVGDTLVTIDFKDVGGHRTEVVLTHERFADQERAVRHEQGWTQLLNLLNGYSQETHT